MLRYIRCFQLHKGILHKTSTRFVREHMCESFTTVYGGNKYNLKLCDMNLDNISDTVEVTEFQQEKLFNFDDYMLAVTEASKEELKEVTKSQKILITEIMRNKNREYFPIKFYSIFKVLQQKIVSIFPDHQNSKDTTVINDKLLTEYLKSAIDNTYKSAAYMDLCILKGDYERAFELLRQIRKENKCVYFLDRKSLIVDSIFYEPAITVLAKQGKLSYIVELLNEMDETRLLPSLPIIFRCFEVVLRSDYLDNDLIAKLIDYAKRHNISAQRMLLKVAVSKENFQYILKAIQLIDPDFKLKVNNSQSMNKVSLENTCISTNIEELQRSFDLQLSLERQFMTSLNSVYKFPLNEKIFEKVKSIEDFWRKILTEAFDKKLALLEYSDRKQLYPFLSILPTSSYVDIMIQTVYRLAVDNNYQFSSVTNVYYLISEFVYNTYCYRRLKKQKYFTQLKVVYLSYFQKLSENPQNQNLDQLWESAILDNIDLGNIGFDLIDWSFNTRRQIGQLIYEIMYENLTINLSSNNKEISSPVLFETTEEGDNTVMVMVKIQSKLKNLLKSIERVLPSFTQVELPMLHPPVNVTNNSKTGYFYLANSKTHFIRKEENYEIGEVARSDKLHHIYNALNILGSCAWKVDIPNLDLISKIFIDNGDMSLEIPLFSDSIRRPGPVKSNSSVKEKFELKKLHFNYQKQKKEMFSLWATVNYKIGIAKFLGNQKFWFPYSMDFRSRVYPCAPHFNHIGNDISRGMLKFSLGKKLGPNGLDWLKIHLINLCGTHKRCSNKQRLQAADEVLLEIIDSAVNPLNGRCWWKTSEKPWQTLLVCREIQNALKFADEAGQGFSNDYVSYVPVHQDGSCNGLQHYAALGKDSMGAKAVNLNVSEFPQDVYSDILVDIVKKQKIDAANGVQEAIDLDNLISRKIIKQSVMTTVYGVTLFGAKEQIKKQLKELNVFTSSQLLDCSIYLAKLTLNSIGEIFSSATSIQKWLVEMASNISLFHKQCISWKTPLNLIITQPYLIEKNGVIKSDTMKNRNAFPPNFVHSLDSTHMMMTALRCWKENITFVSVHDCFWTHACDVDAMNIICREEFVKLHSQPILKNLSDFLYEKYSFKASETSLNKSQNDFNQLLKKIPETGTFDIKNVLNSNYFFS